MSEPPLVWIIRSSRVAIYHPFTVEFALNAEIFELYRDSNEENAASSY